MHSEHAFDGRILMSASLNYPKADTYRSYKLRWIGRPSQPPDVHSVAIQNRHNDGHVTTLVHVSWNGATEVATWTLLHTDHDGHTSELVASSARQGFETALSCDMFAKYVVMVALDLDGKEIGRSKVVETSRPQGLDHSLSVAEEAKWLQDHSSSTFAKIDNWLPQATIAFVLGILSCFIAGCTGVYLVWRVKGTSGEKGTFRWFNRLPGYGSIRAGSSQDDIEQREWMLEEKEVIESERSPT